MSKTFLNKFDPEPVWDVVVPGRIAILRLRGAGGSLDLTVCYLDSSSAPERIAACSKLSQHLKPAAEVLSLVFGDFNVVERDEDRIDKASGLWAGQSNERESGLFGANLLSPHSLHEWPQTEHTGEMAGDRSRIDECYSNLAVSDQ